MRLGFGCTVLAKGLAHGGVDGIGSYTRELGARFSAADDVELVPVSFGIPAGEGFPWRRDALRMSGRYARMALLAALSPLSFPTRDLGKRFDLFHATDHLVPKYRDFPVVATLMDAIPLSHPEWVRMRLARQKNWLWRRAARWADHVLTISEYSRDEIVRHFGIAHDKITVVPLGVDERYFERFDAQRKKETLDRLGLPERFFLCVGTLQPRKNLERVLDAHAALPAALQKDVPLVVVGRNGWGTDALAARLADPAFRGRVHWLKYLPDADVRCLMQCAQALVFASLCEGFGLPVVEAFASGLPVIASNTTSVPEVAGDAALLVDPLDVGGIADAMRQIAGQPGLAARLAAAGEQRARALSWSTCAAQTLDVYRRVLDGR
jgi:alpha-1,3-rhamnosyl/mannosyltransferase